MKKPSIMMLAAISILCSIAVYASPSASDAPASSALPLIHLDTPLLLSQGSVAGRIDVRAFGAKEDLVYTGLAAYVGLGKGLEGIVRGAWAANQDFDFAGGSIRHGGSDVELALKAACPAYPHLAGLVGLSIASTPAQSDVFMTLGAMAETNVGNQVSLYLNPRALFLWDNTLLGIGLGAHAHLTQELGLIGEWTPLITGDNTRDTSTGDRRHGDVYGVALRYARAFGSTAWSIDLGYANGIGSTTGFGLTPGLSNSAAFYFALSAQR